GYTLPAGVGFWVPTPSKFQRPLQPHWGNNRSFFLRSGSECQPGPHPLFSERPGTKFYEEMMEVYNTVNNLTAEQRAIAEFWADNPRQTATPAGHWIAILNQIIAQRQLNLEVAAEAYAKVGIVVADAFISCWYTKYEYNLVRPITCIRKIIDANWRPPVSTPPFPEYTSGHSVQSGAVAQVLTDMFGAVAFTDHTHDSRNLSSRSFSSFFAAADEAAISRLYGGIHFRSAIELGLEQGKCVGRKVSVLKFKKDAPAENAARR
ncbi:MAG: vanadium-dependent haloperoxidase, partial [bacterium]